MFFAAVKKKSYTIYKPQMKYGYEVPRKHYHVSNSDAEDTLYNRTFYTELIMPNFFQTGQQNYESTFAPFSD